MLAGLSFVSMLAGPPAIPSVVPSVVVDGMVDGAPGCPDAATMKAALNGMLPVRTDDAGPDLLRLSPTADGLDVRLTEAGGAMIGEKRLRATGSCQEQAQTVAVLVAAWETRWRSGAPPALPRPARDATPPSPPAAPSPPTTVTRQDLLPEPNAAPLEIETRAGLLASVAGGTVAPAVTCDVGLGTKGSRFAVAVGVLAVAGHDTQVGPATARWQRLGGTIDLRSRLPVPGFSLEMHAAAAFTALSLTGEALPRTNSGTLFDPGVLVGFRARLPVPVVVPWLEATAAFWPAAHTAYVTGTDAQRDLPSFEVLLGAGVSFGAAGPSRPAND